MYWLERSTSGSHLKNFYRRKDHFTSWVFKLKLWLKHRYMPISQSWDIEVEVYTYKVGEITPHGKWNAWGCEFKLLKIKHSDKTYEDYGLGKDPKRTQIDLSRSDWTSRNSREGEQYWIQIIGRAAKEAYHTKKLSGRSITKRIKLGWWMLSRDEAMLDEFTSTKINLQERAKEVRAPDFMSRLLEVWVKDKQVRFRYWDTSILCCKKEAFIRIARRFPSCFQTIASPM